MAIDLKAQTPDTSVGASAVIFGADSTAAATPSIYPIADLKSKILEPTAVFTASGTGAASLRVPHGTPPTSPTNGDFWTTTTTINMRINGSTVTVCDLESNQTVIGKKIFATTSLVAVDIYDSGSKKVVGSRVTGWGTPSGTLDRTALAAYAGQTVSAGYVQAEAQATDNAVKKVSQVLAALITDLRTHGLIGT